MKFNDNRTPKFYELSIIFSDSWTTGLISKDKTNNSSITNEIYGSDITIWDGKMEKKS